MCSVAAAVVGTGAVVGGLTGYSAYSSAQEQKAMASRQESMAEANAAAAERSAASVQEIAEWDRIDLSNKFLSDVGNATAQYGASGVVLGSGSAQQYISGLADTYDLDRKKLDYNTENEVYEKQMAAYNYRQEAAEYRSKKHSINPVFNGAVNGLQGFASGVSMASSLSKGLGGGGYSK